MTERFPIPQFSTFIEIPVFPGRFASERVPKGTLNEKSDQTRRKQLELRGETVLYYIYGRKHR